MAKTEISNLADKVHAIAYLLRGLAFGERADEADEAATELRRLEEQAGRDRLTIVEQAKFIEQQQDRIAELEARLSITAEFLPSGKTYFATGKGEPTDGPAH